MFRFYAEKAIITDIYLSVATDPKYPDRLYSQVTSRGTTLRVSWVGLTPKQLQEVELEPCTIDATLIGRKIGTNGQMIELHAATITRIIPK